MVVSNKKVLVTFGAILICVFLLGFTPAAPNARANEKNTLVLHSYHKGLPWTDHVTEGIESVFQANGQNPYNQLERFKVRLSALPEDSIVINKPFSFYSNYKKLVWQVIAVIFVLILIVFTLGFNIIKRKKAEAELVKTNSKLESKIEERTLALRQSNQQLKDEIIERKQAEEELKNIICKLECTQIAMEQKEKLAIIGQMAAGMAHEIKNPLTSVRGFAQILRDNCTDKTLAAYAETVLKEVDQANKVIMDFLQLARPKPPVFEKQSINNLIKEILDIIEPQAYLNNVEVSYQDNEDLPRCMLDRNQIKQVLLNFCQNAIEAMPGGGKITIRSGLSPETREIFLDIKDTGYGISKENLKNVGVPFFTTKDYGTGLGLSISYSIINAHQGRIEIHSEQGKGTTFRIFLPY